MTEENFYFVEKFKGWAVTENGNIEDWTEANIGRASKDRTFYPVFEKVSVYDNVITDMSWFNFRAANGQLTMAKSGLSGKITLPAQFEGQDILRFSGVGILQEGVTHIFCFFQ